jgi:hypothetical protein
MALSCDFLDHHDGDHHGINHEHGQWLEVFWTDAQAFRSDS